jgi:hypothetical protein
MTVFQAHEFVAGLLSQGGASIIGKRHRDTNSHPAAATTVTATGAQPTASPASSVPQSVLQAAQAQAGIASVDHSPGENNSYCELNVHVSDPIRQARRWRVECPLLLFHAALRMHWRPDYALGNMHTPLGASLNAK